MGILDVNRNIKSIIKFHKHLKAYLQTCRKTLKKFSP